MTLLIASAFPLNATADATDDIPTNAAGTGEHGSLLSALTYVGLNTTLEGTGPFTVFAPTDQAFDDAGIDLANFQTQEEKDMLTDISESKTHKKDKWLEALRTLSNPTRKSYKALDALADEYQTIDVPKEILKPSDLNRLISNLKQVNADLDEVVDIIDIN